MSTEVRQWERLEESLRSSAWAPQCTPPAVWSTTLQSVLHQGVGSGSMTSQLCGSFVIFKDRLCAKEEHHAFSLSFLINPPQATAKQHTKTKNDQCPSSIMTRIVRCISRVMTSRASKREFRIVIAEALLGRTSGRPLLSKVRPHLPQARRHDCQLASQMPLPSSIHHQRGSYFVLQCENQ